MRTQNFNRSTNVAMEHNGGELALFANGNTAFDRYCANRASLLLGVCATEAVGVKLLTLK